MDLSGQVAEDGLHVGQEFHVPLHVESFRPLADHRESQFGPELGRRLEHVQTAEGRVGILALFQELVPQVNGVGRIHQAVVRVFSALPGGCCCHDAGIDRSPAVPVTSASPWHERPLVRPSEAGVAVLHPGRGAVGEAAGDLALHVAERRGQRRRHKFGGRRLLAPPMQPVHRGQQRTPKLHRLGVLLGQGPQARAAGLLEA
mmetsp:Transcript_4780/g.14248  ORF Transcript_4780/g.14248 Transcript_4780/m.14248 type:complete len:202 (-) Transcript_4780:460-1065(-)